MREKGAERMVVFIHVTLLRGTFQQKKQLRDLVATIFQNDVSIKRQSRADGVQKYIADILRDSIYSCIPRPASQAWFLWLTELEFLIVVETFYQGNLLLTSEGILKALIHRFKKLKFNLEYHISLQSPRDAQTYVTGLPNSLIARLKESLKDNIAWLLIAFIIVVIADRWWPEYYHEALAGLIGLSLFSLWEFISVWIDVHKHPIHWSIRHHD